MAQENSNDARPAEQTAPEAPPAVAADCPEEYITIKIPKGKVRKCVRLALVILLAISLWMNLVFLHAIMRGRHVMTNRMGHQWGAQLQMPGARGDLFMAPSHTSSSSQDFHENGNSCGFSNRDAYYNDGYGLEGYSWEFEQPSR